MEDDVVGLREANDEHAVDDTKPHEILSQHSTIKVIHKNPILTSDIEPVNHDDHGSYKLEPSAEEQEVETIGEHDNLHDDVFNDIETEDSGWYSELI